MTEQLTHSGNVLQRIYREREEKQRGRGGRYSLKSLSKRELLSFISNHKGGDTNVFENLADCLVCGKSKNPMYIFECGGCQDAEKTDG